MNAVTQFDTEEAAQRVLIDRGFVRDGVTWVKGGQVVEVRRDSWNNKWFVSLRRL